MEVMIDFLLLASRITADVDGSVESEDNCFFLGNCDKPKQCAESGDFTLPPKSRPWSSLWSHKVVRACL